MKHLLLIVPLLVILPLKNVISQDAKFFPPATKPVTGIIPAKPEVRIYDFSLVKTEKGHFFNAKIDVIFWAGLNDKGEKIKFDYKSSEQKNAADFVKIEGDFAGIAYVTIGSDTAICQQVSFTLKKNQHGCKIRFPLIPKNKNILPAFYRLTVEFPLQTQGDLRDYIWSERTRMKPNEGVKIIRENPMKALAPRKAATIYIGGKLNDSYENVRSDTLSFFSQALNGIQIIGDCEK